MNRLKRLGINSIGVLVDVGGHSGSFIDEVKLDYSPFKIVTIEPNWDRARELSNRHPDVVVAHYAAGSVNSRGIFNQYTHDQASSLLKMYDGVSEKYGFSNPVTGQVEVEIRTLDNILENVLGHIGGIDLLKIDVQGYELQVIAGAEKTLDKTKHIIVEMNCIPQYERGSTFGSVYEALVLCNDFQLQHIFAPNCGVENLLHYDERIILHCDAHFVHR